MAYSIGGSQLPTTNASKPAGKNKFPRQIGLADQNQQREWLQSANSGSYFSLGPKAAKIRFIAMLAVLVLCQLLTSPAAVAQKTLPRRIRAPELEGGGWLNTKAPLGLDDLRGKFVVLDFWTYCCINCKHILPELKKLEHKYDKNIVVIGVHSPKFENERDEENVREAIVRYDIEHPVLTDPQRSMWRRYEVGVWPSLRIIDPEGYVIAVHEGEISFAALDRYFSRQVSSYRRRSKLDETPIRFDLERAKRPPSPLHYPGKVLADAASQRLFIADSSNHRIVVADLQGNLQTVVGEGVAGDRDGSFSAAQFRDPQGMAVDGDKLYVADTENHKIRLVDLTSQTVTTIAGAGAKRDQAAPGQTMRASTQLASPWDVLLHNGRLIIAMAGTHQIWQQDLASGMMRVLAGNGVEDIIDGPGPPRGAYKKGTSSFAQPSGLATDGTRVFIADSEGSSIRYMPLEGGDVGTLVGTANLPSKRLFTFGDRDGPATRALLQHPIGVAYHQQQVLVADTYNHKIRAVNTATGAVSTLLGNGKPGRSDEPSQLDEPGGVSVAGNRLYIADTNNHAIRVYDFTSRKLTTLKIEGLKPPTAPRTLFNGPQATALQPRELPAMAVRPVNGQLRMAMDVSLPADSTLNQEAPARVTIEWPQGNPLAPPKPAPVSAKVFNGKLYAAAPLGAAEGSAKVTIKLEYFYCRNGEQKFCRPGAARWSGTVHVKADGAMMLELD